MASLTALLSAPSSSSRLHRAVRALVLLPFLLALVWWSLPLGLRYDISGFVRTGAAWGLAVASAGGDAGCAALLPPAEASTAAASGAGVSVCTIVRDEARYLGEWVAFHRAQGVSHMDVWDDGSSDGTAEVLAPWVAAGVLVLRPLEGARAMLAALVAGTARRRASAPRACAPTDADLGHLTASVEGCLSTRNTSNHVPCQVRGVGVGWGELDVLCAGSFWGLLISDPHPPSPLPSSWPCGSAPPPPSFEAMPGSACLMLTSSCGRRRRRQPAALRRLRRWGSTVPPCAQAAAGCGRHLTTMGPISCGPPSPWKGR